MLLSFLIGYRQKYPMTIPLITEVVETKVMAMKMRNVLYATS